MKEILQLSRLKDAWDHVRPRARGSSNPQTRKELGIIEGDVLAYLRTIQREIGRGAFRFSPQRAVLKRRSGKSPRGLVVAPLRNRIVQRAILDVCQSDRRALTRHLGALPKVLWTPTSVGGLPGRGVQDAMWKIRAAIEAGATHYVRSDIHSFFVHVRKADVHAFLDANIADPAFLDLFKQALDTELENSGDDEIRQWWSLFPNDDTGVAQGASLSALCANIVLAPLDQALNERRIVTVRYLDDFLILAPNRDAANKAWTSAKRILTDLGLAAHEPGPGSTKAARGRVEDGLDFLSFHINAREIGPSKSARDEFLSGLDGRLRGVRRDISASADEPRRAQAMFVQSLADLDRRVRGWGDAFRQSTRRLEFSQMDQKIDDLMNRHIAWFMRKVEGAGRQKRRRMWGVALLRDTEPARAPPAVPAPQGRAPFRHGKHSHPPD